MTNHQRWFQSEAVGILRRRRMLQMMAACVGLPTAVSFAKKDGLSPTRIWLDERFTEEVLPRGGNRMGLTNRNAVNLATAMRGYPSDHPER